MVTLEKSFLCVGKVEGHLIPMTTPKHIKLHSQKINPLLYHVIEGHMTVVTLEKSFLCVGKVEGHLIPMTTQKHMKLHSQKKNPFLYHVIEGHMTVVTLEKSFVCWKGGRSFNSNDHSKTH